MGAGLLGLATCTAQAQTITVWVHAGPGPERDAYAASVKAFNERPAALRGSAQAQLMLVPEATYGDEVARAAAAGRLPCVLEFDGPNVAAYAAGGQLLPLDGFDRLASVRRTLLSSVARQGTVNGRLYSLGQYDSGLALWGNREWLQKVGVRIPARADSGWTLAEFEDVLKKLKAAGVASPLDMKFNYGVGEWFTYGFAPILQGFGGDLIDRSEHGRAQGVINGPAAVKAMSSFQGWVNAGYVDTAPTDDKAFVSGRSALSWVGHWVFKDYRRALGERLVLLPLPHFGSKPVTGSGSWNFGIAASCAHPQAAAAFIEHLMSRVEILRVTDINGAVPATGAALAFSPDYALGGPLRLYAEQLMAGHARVRPQTPHYPLVSRAFAQAVAQIAKGADVQRALNTAAETIDQGLARAATATPLPAKPKQ
ncbi:MAG: sugar ABC transporter substrate-binding protein [Rhizobacter sp.]|nr:sugar ABC transporter substrate-binding protein [Rhizobacter sp.]